MSSPDLPDLVVRFGEFIASLETGELHRNGTKVKLHGQPFAVLSVLLKHPGRLVTREELRSQLWPSDTFVDFEHGLNAAVNRLREALEDSATEPRFIETIPRRGYRFVAAIEGACSLAPAAEATQPPPVKPVRRSVVVRFALVLGVIIVAAGASFFAHRRTGTPPRGGQRSLTRLTFEDGLQVGATWSPDGRYIAYSSDRGGKFDIWVQQVSGGDPVQITKGPGHHWQPDWSPDGNYIAYRSEDGDGGIYVVPALGGAGLERKVAPFGYYPHWSPNSLEVLFQTQSTAIGYSNRFYVAQLGGGAPREVLAEFLAQNKLWARSADWHPDGKRVTVWVGDVLPSPAFWVVPIIGGAGTKLEVPAAVQKELAEASTDGESGDQQGEYTFSWSPSGNAIYFERGFRGARNIWKMRVDPETLRATGVDRLTTGPGSDAGLAVSNNGRWMAFTARSQRIRTWLFAFDATTGRIRGGEAITSPGRNSTEPVLSPDGTKVAYEVLHGESYGMAFGDVRNEVWVKSLVDGQEVPVAAVDHSRWGPVWSPDGVHLVYERRELKTRERQLILWSSQSHDEEPITTLGNTPILAWDWSRDGKWLLVCGGEGGIFMVPVASAPHAESAAKKITSDSGYQLYQPHFSPDGRWIVFEATANSPNPESSLYVVSASGGPWIRVTDSKHWDDKPRWSPDGKTIYFLSRRVGFFNVWGVHFDPAVGKTIGQPFQVSKFESSRLMIPRNIGAVGLSFAQGKLVLTMAEESGNIWVLDDVDR